ncbi:Asp-tRNA(Asn)/Glu-tRNA(Gln) amidotransferase subunit GatB [Candidatus Uhrbacteria bacterium]|jgi:aspartyl-tRNA(Asn)/glutamyl-tRNA(Gln) amidotransferase subunit B|nr:Asp-tRNA(Asn)/Glu-tRNA(Gln) amidotransferase subunit GatB [Candidatus Uhrbacteria bacterium]MBT7717528.1 Asp-tRNA(Asn)/Glu-tRNA(Gln) amidotransferase subunit GatB [Candidatus Uhrbacteria bacterium]
MNLQPVIGLETHVQLKTNTKMFCACSARGQDEAPNTHVCPVCLGHPGVLPVPNEQAVRWAILVGLALRGTIATRSKFDRKNYFYPDLPKAYQISQFDLPVMENGEVEIEIPGREGSSIVRLERLHLEEDAAKNIHGDDGKTYVDFNRGGTPLCEIVTRPDIHSAEEAKAYTQEIRLLVRSLQVSNGDMEKGQLRCDVNISMREVDDNGEPLDDILHPKTEIKNVNSFKAIGRVIEHEIQRQTKLWKMGTPPSQTTTRGWNDVKQMTYEQRIKEGFADYRYFPEPDIPPLDLTEMTEEIRRTIPELPWDRKKRFATEYGFKKEDIKQMIDDPALADYTENAMSELASWLQSREDVNEDNVLEHRKKLNKLFSSWLLNKLMGLLTERKIDIRTMKVTTENFAEFIVMLAEGKVTGTKGLEVLGAMLDSGADPEHVVEDLGASRMDDMDALLSIVDTVIEENPAEAERFRNGEQKLMQFFLGQIMKITKGNADPATSAKVLKDKLK